MSERTLRIPGDELRLRVERAFKAFFAVYTKNAGYQFAPFKPYKGPLVWTEGDVVYRFALELEKQFPRMVHLEMPIAKFNVANYQPEDKNQYVDIVVSDLTDFDPASEDFRRRRHDLFIEAKFISRRAGVTSARADALRLDNHLRRGNCAAAAIFVVDDIGYFEQRASEFEWPRGVLRLIASERQVSRRKLARRAGVALPVTCGSCGSSRLATIAYGMPTAHTERKIAQQVVVSGGCEERGGDCLWQCLDCEGERRAVGG